MRINLHKPSMKIFFTKDIQINNLKGIFHETLIKKIKK
jgi:hypothetical protein